MAMSARIPAPGDHRRSNPCGTLRDLTPGEAHHAPPLHLQRHVSLTIRLERARRPVIRVAVDLDDEAPIAPHEVDLEALDADVRLGPRDAVGIAEREEAILELRSCRGGVVGSQHRL
jgi:hypothetical protein